MSLFSVNMLTIAFASFLCFTLINGSVVKEEKPEGESGWSANLDWLYDKMYSPSTPEPNPKDESPIAKSEGPDQQNTNQIFKIDQTSNEHKSSKKVDDILEIIDNSSDEEKKGYMPLLEDLEKTIVNEPARYVKIFIKNVGHIVDLGVFKSGERRRNEQKVKNLYEKIRDLIIELYNAVYNFISDRIEAAQVGAQKGWAYFEKKNEGDPREWTEEKAQERLSYLEKNYKTMGQNENTKEELIKDVLSLSMQPLLKVSTYERILDLLDRLLNDKDMKIETAKLDKAFNYVGYKAQFSKDHKII